MPSREILLGGGNIHCITQQVPAPSTEPSATDAGQRERVVAGGVGEPAAHLQAGAGVDGLEPLAGELGRDLGPHLLAGGEGDLQVEAVDRDLLVGERAQADVHPLRLGVVAGDVLEGVEVEVGAELAVEHLEHVLVELGGDAGGVVVGGLEPVAVLDQVGAEQELVAGPQQRRDPLEEGLARARVEVADGAAEEGDQPAAVGRGDPLQVLLEVADEAADGEAGVLVDQAGGRLVGDLLGDVDRDVGLEAAGVAHRVEQVAGLRRRAGAELDQGAGPAGGGEDLGRALG